MNPSMLFVADAGNHVIRSINLSSSSYGNVTTLIGAIGSQGSQDGLANVARLSFPRDCFIAKSGTLYIPGGRVIKKAIPVFVNDIWTYNVTSIVGKYNAQGATDGIAR